MAPIDCTGNTVERLMASKANKAGPHNLHLLWFGEMNSSVEDGQHFLHDVVAQTVANGMAKMSAVTR